MPTTTTTTSKQTTVTLTPAELQGYITSLLPSLAAADGSVIQERNSIPGKFKPSDGTVSLRFTTTDAQLSQFLGTLIPNLPSNYSIKIVKNNPNIGAIITWND